MQVIIDGTEYVPIVDKPLGNGLLDALAIRFDCDIGDNITIREYLHALLKTLWDEGEGFSGKRPFGNSGWEGDLEAPLVRAGYVTGLVDKNGDVFSVDQEEYSCFVFDLIAAMCFGTKEK